MLVGSIGACIWFISVLKVVGFKLIIVLAPIAWILIWALWVVIPAPEGLRVTRNEAPELFALIDDVQKRVGAPPFHEVIIDADFNAAVMQIPRLGVFGWFRNYLIIGLPLLKTLTPEQFKAVLSHEYGHLAGGHAKLSNWIYRQRLRWTRLLQSLEARDGEGSALFMGFLRRYAPYLNAYSFPLARANEYEADAVAARVTTVAAMAQALSAVKVGSTYLSETFWPGVYRGVNQTPVPDAAPYLRLSEQLHADKAGMPRDRWLGQAMRRKTSIEDTHPSLADRLEAIGGRPDLNLPVPGAAADQLLGAALASVTERLDREWTEKVADHWRSQFDNANQDRETLSILNAKHAAGETLEFEQIFQRALLLDSVANDKPASVALLRDLHSQKPELANVTFALATRLLQQNDEAGLAMMEQLIEQSIENALPCGQTMYEFHIRHDQHDKAEGLAKRINEQVEELRAAEVERNTFKLTDRLVPHGLDAKEIESLRQQIGKISGIDKVYVVQKQCQYQPKRLFYVVGFSIKDSWKWGRKERIAAAMSPMRNEVVYPGETLIVPFDSDNKSFFRQMKEVEGAHLI